MSLSSAIRARSVREVLHFTTNKGLVGILATKAVKSRALLSREHYLEHIFHPNVRIRRDPQWLGHVSLSISRPNAKFFTHVATKWHAPSDVWWCILSFDANVLAHGDVVFTTTNNIYTGVLRTKGAVGFKAQFGDSIHWYGTRYVHRPSIYPIEYTTCEQAEALYPQEIDIKHVLCVYISKPEHFDEIAAIAETFSTPITVELRPDLFPGL